MNTVANIKKVSLLFFIVLTGAHILSSLMLANEYFNDTMSLLNKTLDLPAILAGIIYGFTSLKLYLEETGKDTKIFDVVAGALGGIILIAAIYLNFFA
tara:strand:+ start:865 stop:1158 length:294 start_codon:yes stop_codon:yes gene_type:complete